MRGYLPKNKDIIKYAERCRCGNPKHSVPRFLEVHIVNGEYLYKHKGAESNELFPLIEVLRSNEGKIESLTNNT